MDQQQIPIVELDSEGIFKYILIKRTQEGREDYFVRGYKEYEFHADNFERFSEDLQQFSQYNNIKAKVEKGVITCTTNSKAVEFKCIGGGRVAHSQSKQTLSLYGYSQSYGQADHNITLNVVKCQLNYPETNYQVSFEGY